MDGLRTEITRHIYSVSELTREIKQLLEKNCADVWVSGEVSNYTRAASCHVYFTLKDEKTVMRAVFFKGMQKDIRFELENGLKVIVHGMISVFEKRGEYQIKIDFIEPEGLGALQLAFEQLKEKLRKEGLFDESRKKGIPAFPEVIGVITSPTGAAIRDILNVIERRFRGLRVIIYPAMVQGEDAAGSIVEAVQKANKRKETDVLIVGRGGGSIEDLWPFNDEIVARALFQSKIPVISAVGHEIDFTISDFVADVRAPTPSAAAEIVVQNKRELLVRFADLHGRLSGSIDRIFRVKMDSLSHYTVDVLYGRLSTLLNEKLMIMDDLTKSLINIMEVILTKIKGRFEKQVGELNVLSPLGTLSRGYSITSRFHDNRPIVTIGDVARGEAIRSRLKDGTLLSTITDIEHKKHMGPQ
jgi:exodeoxyribonuclease VII large subunit